MNFPYSFQSGWISFRNVAEIRHFDKLENIFSLGNVLYVFIFEQILLKITNSRT